MARGMTIYRHNSDDYIINDPNIADEFSTSATYAVGDRVYYAGELYRCISAITTAESWTAAHWQKVSVNGEIQSIENNLTDVENLLMDQDYVFEELKNTYLKSDGTTEATSGYTTTVLLPAHFGQIVEFTIPSTYGVMAAFYNGSGTLLQYTSSKWRLFPPIGTESMRLCSFASTLKNYKIKVYEPEIRKIDEPPIVYTNARIADKYPLSDAAGYYCTWFIDLCEEKQIRATLMSDSYNGGYQFYDKDFASIGDSMTLYKFDVVRQTTIKVPSTAKYIVFGSYGVDLSVFNVLSYSPKLRDVYVGTGRKYTSILNALRSEHGAVRFIIESGTYNVVNEYKAEYGDDFWDEYEGYIGFMDPYLRGLTPLEGQQMIFRQGSKVVFDYSGNNENVFIQFSVFNLSMDNVLEGVRCDFGNRICRYCIHDDMASGEGTNIIRNCTFNGTSYNGPVIGGGCGSHCEYLIEHCFFENNEGSADVMYHNGLPAGVVNRVHVRDCKGDVGVVYLYCGDSTLVSDFLVSNSKFPVIACQPHQVEGYTVPPPENIRLIEFCNDKTPVDE